MESHFWLSGASDSSSSSWPWKEGRLCRGRLESWVPKGSSPSPTPEAAFLQRSAVGEGRPEALGAQTLVVKSFLLQALVLEGRACEAPALRRSSRSAAPCSLVWVRGRQMGPMPTRGEAGALHFLLTFFTSSFTTCPRCIESRWNWQGRQTWTGIFARGERQ